MNSKSSKKNHGGKNSLRLNVRFFFFPFFILSLLLHPYGVYDRNPFSSIFIFNGSRTHAVTMVRTELTGAWTKKRGRERA